MFVMLGSLQLRHVRVEIEVVAPGGDLAVLHLERAHHRELDRRVREVEHVDPFGEHGVAVRPRCCARGTRRRSAGVRNMLSRPRIASRPTAGSTGMLWYTASSVKYSTSSVGRRTLAERLAELEHQGSRVVGHGPTLYPRAIGTGLSAMMAPWPGRSSSREPRSSAAGRPTARTAPYIGEEWNCPIVPHGGLVTATTRPGDDRRARRSRPDAAQRHHRVRRAGAGRPGRDRRDRAAARPFGLAAAARPRARPGADAGHTTLAVFGRPRHGFEFTDATPPVVPPPARMPVVSRSAAARVRRATRT